MGAHRGDGVKGSAVKLSSRLPTPAKLWARPSWVIPDPGRRCTCRLLQAVVAVAMAACAPPTGPSAPQVPVAGGRLDGRYVLRIEPASSCPSPAAALSFVVQARADDTPRYPGYQVVLEGAPATVREMELQYAAPAAQGGLGTTELGAPSLEGVRVWVRGVVRGTVVSDRSGLGQIAGGVPSGDLAFGSAPDQEGALGSCSSVAHRFSLSLA